MRVTGILLAPTFMVTLVASVQLSLAQLRVIPLAGGDIPALIGQHRGKVVLLNVWATWCPPCIEEFPDLMRLRTEYRTRGLEVIFVSADDMKKSENKVRTFLLKQKVDFDTYVKSAGWDEEFITALHPDWSGALPATFIYDREGNLVHALVDSRTHEEFVSLIKPLLP
jgi:thiol-disulfide isomerase/thioredoxin